jgi:hypothetical protein
VRCPKGRRSVAAMVVQGATNNPSCRNTYCWRLGPLFLHSRISHQSELSSNVVFVLQIYWIAHFPGIIRALSGLDGGTNNPSCRNPYRRRSGLLFLDSRISHQSELSGKSLSFSAVVQNTWRLSLLRKLGDRLDLDIHRYHINTPISHRLIWLCALLYPSLATSAAQIRYAAQMSGVGTVRLQRGLLNVCPQSISYLSDLKLPCQFL